MVSDLFPRSTRHDVSRFWSSAHSNSQEVLGAAILNGLRYQGLLSDGMSYNKRSPKPNDTRNQQMIERGNHKSTEKDVGKATELLAKDGLTDHLPFTRRPVFEDQRSDGTTF
jgi:hypothetical protein